MRVLVKVDAPGLVQPGFPYRERFDSLLAIDSGRRAG